MSLMLMIHDSLYFPHVKKHVLLFWFGEFVCTFVIRASQSRQSSDSYFCDKAKRHLVLKGTWRKNVLFYE